MKFSYRDISFTREQNLVLVDLIKQYAAKKGCTPSQLALAWVHAQWDSIIAIPGTTRIEALQENLGSAKISLSKDELTEVSSMRIPGMEQRTRSLTVPTDPRSPVQLRAERRPLQCADGDSIRELMQHLAREPYWHTIEE
jgi:hypothetical protein